MDNDFDNVTWSNESSQAAAAITPPVPHPAADHIDLAGIDSGALDCEVGAPLREGASKDAYISYMVTTTVSLYTMLIDPGLPIDRLQILPKAYNTSPTTFHGLCILIQKSLIRLSSLRRTTTSRQTADGVRERG